MFFPSTLLSMLTARSDGGGTQSIVSIPLNASAQAPQADQQGTLSSVEDENAQALSQLYEAFRRPIYSYCYRLLGNQEDAADVTQEVFLRSCLAWERLRDRHHLFPWLHQVATHLCVDLLRQRKRLAWWPLGRQTHEASSDEDDKRNQESSFLLSGGGGIPEIAEREHIYLTLAQMPTEAMLALVLNTVQGIPYQEVATLLGTSPGAAATRISRAKKLFIEQYQLISHERKTQEKRS